MKPYVVQLICWSLLLTVLLACRSKTPKPVGAIIDTAIPNGLVPGSALTLKGHDFGTVTSVQFANTSVASGTFIRTATDELTLKVPLNTQGGEVRVVGEKGPGQPKQMNLLTGDSGITADNISTTAGGITQGSYSDDCSPGWFIYCLQGTCLIYYYRVRRPRVGAPANSTNESDYCQQSFTTESIGGSSYEVYKHEKATLKFEKQNNSSSYTGFVCIVTPDGKIYWGNVTKTGSIVGSSVADGSVIQLCRPLKADNSIRAQPTFYCQGVSGYGPPVCNNCK